MKPIRSMASFVYWCSIVCSFNIIFFFSGCLCLHWRWHHSNLQLPLAKRSIKMITYPKDTLLLPKPTAIHDHQKFVNRRICRWTLSVPVWACLTFHDTVQTIIIMYLKEWLTGTVFRRRTLCVATSFEGTFHVIQRATIWTDSHILCRYLHSLSSHLINLCVCSEIIKNKTLQFLSKTLPYLKSEIDSIPKVARFVKPSEFFKKWVDSETWLN